MESMFDPQACNFTRADQPCSQSLGLDGRSGRKVTARNAVGESCVVLDARAGTGLAARTDGVEGNSVKAL